MTKGKIESNITRLMEQRVENLSKMDAASSPNEEEHYRRLAEKNDEAIEMYNEMLEEVAE